MTITRILAALQESLLVNETTRDGWKISEHLKQCKPIAVSFDPQNL